MALDPVVFEALRNSTRVLEELSLKYAAIGGVARNAWGTARATTDIDFDLDVDPPQLEQALARLHAAGFLGDQVHGPADRTDALPDSIFLRAGTPDGVRIDLLLSKTPFQVQAVGRAMELAVFGEPFRVITAEDLVVYKLVAFRPRDRLDIEDVLDVQRRKRPIDIDHIDHWAEEWGVTDRWLVFREALRKI